MLNASHVKSLFYDIKEATKRNASASASTSPQSLVEFINNVDDLVQFFDAHCKAERLSGEVEMPPLPSQLTSMSGSEFVVYIRSAAQKVYE